MVFQMYDSMLIMTNISDEKQINPFKGLIFKILTLFQ